MQKVKLTYFKSHGTYYSNGLYESKSDYHWEIVEEIRILQAKKELPGLIKGSSDFHVLIEIGGSLTLLPINIIKPYLILDSADLEKYLKDAVTSLDFIVRQKGKLVCYTRLVTTPDNTLDIFEKILQFMKDKRKKDG